MLGVLGVGTARYCWRKARPFLRQPIRRADRRADKPSGCGVENGMNVISAPVVFAEAGVFRVRLSVAGSFGSETTRSLRRDGPSGLRPINGLAFL